MEPPADAFGLDDVQAIWQEPEFLNAAPDRRERILTEVLRGAYQEVVSAPDYAPENYQLYTQLADGARAKLAGIKSGWESTKEVVGGVGHAVGGMVKAAGTAVMAGASELDPTRPAGEDSPLTKAVGQAFDVGMLKGLDAVDVSLGRLSGAQKPADAALDKLKADVDAGAFPVQSPDDFEKWLGGHSAAISAGQNAMWTDRTPEDLQRFQVAADPDSRAFLTDYMVTRDPKAWKQFREQALKTPARRTLEQADAAIARQSPGARWMDRTFGDGAGEHILAAGDPANIAMLILPMARAARGLAAAEQLAAGAGRASTLSGRALAVAKESAKGVPEMATFGAEGTLRQNPQATGGDVAQGAMDTTLAGLAIGAGTFGAREGFARGLQKWNERSPEAVLARYLEQADPGTLVEKPATLQPWQAPANAPEVKPSDKQPKGKQPRPPKEAPPVEPGPNGRPVESIDADLDALDADTSLTDLDRAARRTQLVEERAAAARRSAPSTLLEYAGFGLDEVKALHDAQDAGSVTMPESVRTLGEQFALMLGGRKPGVFVDGVQPEQLPKVLQPREHIQALASPEGTLLFDSRRISPEEAQAAMAGGKIGKILGYGIEEKPADGDRVATLRTSDGHEIASVVVNDATEQTVHDSLAAMGEAEHGDFVEIEPVDIALARRDQARRAEVDDIVTALRVEEESRAFAEKQRAAQKRSATAAKGAGIPDHPDGRRDILDDIASEGGIHLPPPEQRRGKGEHDEMARLAQELPPRYRSIFKADSSIQADAMAQMLHERYPAQITAPHPDNLADAIRSAIRDRMDARGKRAEFLKQERHGLAVEERQQIAFESDVIDPPSLDKQNRQRIAGEQLSVGDEFRVGTETIQVTDVDPDSGVATLQDGERYGTKTVAPDQTLYVEKIPTVIEKEKKITPAQTGGRVAVAEGRQRVEDAKERLREIIQNEDIVGRDRVDAIENGQNLIGFLQSKMGERELDVGWFNGHQVAWTHEDAPEGFQSFIYLEGPRAGATGVSATAKTRDSNAQRVKDEWRSHQEALRRVRELENKSKGSRESDPFNTVAAALPPGPLAAGPAQATPAGPPIGLAEIRRWLLGRVGLPAVGVGRFAQQALGIYRVKPEAIRMRAIEDLPTLAHEIGHHLHRLLDPKLYDGTGHLFRGQFDSELIPLGSATSKPGYTPQQILQEGVAEFTRLWLTDPSRAMAAAPAFASHFKGELSRQNPRMWAGLEEGQRKIARYIAQPAWQKLGSQLVFDLPRSQRTVGEFLRAAYSKWVNTLQPITDVTKAAERIDPTLARQAAGVRTLIENHRGGFQSRTHHDIEFDQTDITGKVVGPGLKTILADLAPEHIQDFSKYIAIRRAMEIESRGMRSGFDFAGATGWRSDVAKWEPIFEPIREKLIAFQDNSLKLLVDSGLVGKDAYAAMKAANRDYVPFHRVYETMRGADLGHTGHGGGYVNVGSGVRRMRGDSRAIVDPLQAIVKNAFTFRKLAEQNRIGREFFRLLGDVQGHGRWGDAIAARMTPTKISHQTVVDHLTSIGLVSGPNDPLLANRDLALTLWRASQVPDAKNGEVFVYRDGKATRWQIRDPLLYDALRNADSDQVGLARIIGPTLAKAVTVPTRLLRWGATGHPIFAITNWTRDQLAAGVFSQNGYIPFIDGVRGAIHVLSKDQTYRDWVKHGGKFSAQVTSDRAYQLPLQDALPKQRGARAMMASLMDRRKIREGLALASQILEEATRVQEFANARARGVDAAGAANMSKEVTLNFSRAGQYSRAVNQLTAFFNAGVQDMDKIVRQHLDPKTRGATVMKGLMYITAPSVAAWYLGKDDPDIQKLPEWRRNFFWNISLHGVAKSLGRQGFVLSIPKPFLMGAIYGTTVERALDAATGRDPNGMRKAMTNIVSNTIFHGNLVGGFTAVQPIAEVTANYDAFTQGQVVPDQLLDMPKPMQFQQGTSDIARKIGRWTGQSPMVIDHLITGYLGTAGRYGSQGVDYAMAKLGMAESAASPPAKDIFEIPPFRSFAGSPYERSVDVTRFFNGAKQVEGLLAAWKKQAPLMTDDATRAWWRENGALIQWYQGIPDDKASTARSRAGQITADKKALTQINAAMRMVQSDKALSPQEKRRRLIQLTTDYNQTAKSALQHFHPATRKAIW